MKLRTRLFLWVAAAFTGVFFSTFYFEGRASRVNVGEVRQELLLELKSQNEKKKKLNEELLAGYLNVLEGQIDFVFRGVDKFQNMREEFNPSPENMRDKTWLHSSSLIATNKWISFIQNRAGDEIMAQITLDDQPLKRTLHFPINENLTLVAIQKEKRDQWDGPFVGVKLDIGALNDLEAEDIVSENTYVLFRKETLLEFKKPNQNLKKLTLSTTLFEPFLRWVALPDHTFYLSKLVERLAEAQTVLLQHRNVVPEGAAWDSMIHKKLGEGKRRDSVTEGSVEDEVRLFTRKAIKVGLTWGLATITASDLFGTDPNSPNAPVGMALTREGMDHGKGLSSHEVFRSHELYRGGQERLHPIELGGKTPLFLGKTLQLPWKGKKGELTIGVQFQEVLRSLSRATHQFSLVAIGDRIMAISNASGDPVNLPEWNHIDIKKLEEETSGLVQVGGESYYYLHLASPKNEELHFYIFNPSRDEFALVNMINDETGKVVNKIAKNIRFGALIALAFVLLLLEGIVRRITKPITHLAEVTHAVEEGHLESIDIPHDFPKKRSDEVHELYRAFFNMVKGLREKERVRGVLNKVVSKEIAEETLKGNVELGGEQRKVTVLFADIRNFTQITERMPPKDVIDLVNLCMTKVSSVIDSHAGVIDKYIGDEVMALFGAPIEKGDGALQAVQCGIEILECLKEWNQERCEKGLPQIEMGIGVHTGEMVAGNMGAENRLNYTVLGANVNLAARLCQQAKPQEMLISEVTLEEPGVKGRIKVSPVQRVELKGFKQRISVYSVTSSLS